MLERLLDDNSDRLSFTTSYYVLLEGCRILFIAVDTPSYISGDADLAQRIWEEIDGLANSFIWQILLSF